MKMNILAFAFAIAAIMIAGCVSFIPIPEGSTLLLDQDVGKFMKMGDSINFSIEQPENFSRLIVVVKGTYTTDDEPSVMVNGVGYKEREYSGGEFKYVFQSFSISNALSFKKGVAGTGSVYVRHVKVWGIPEQQENQ